jgi:hypothetical protein
MVANAGPEGTLGTDQPREEWVLWSSGDWAASATRARS